MRASSGIYASVSGPQHGSVCRMAVGFGSRSSVRSRRTETVLPVLLEGFLLFAKGGALRRQTGGVQIDIERFHCPGSVHPAGAAHPR